MPIWGPGTKDVFAPDLFPPLYNSSSTLIYGRCRLSLTDRYFVGGRRDCNCSCEQCTGIERSRKSILASPRCIPQSDRYIPQPCDSYDHRSFLPCSPLSWPAPTPSPPVRIQPLTMKSSKNSSKAAITTCQLALAPIPAAGRARFVADLVKPVPPIVLAKLPAPAPLQALAQNKQQQEEETGNGNTIPQHMLKPT